MHVNKARIDPAKLRDIPESERALFVLLGHFVNEMNVLNKTFYLCSQFKEYPKWRAHAHTSQGLIFARVLTGKLYEGWILLKKGYFEAKISKSYDEHLNSDAKVALQNLKKYFGRNNLIETVRNNFSFHYSLADTQAALNRELHEDELLIYLAENNGNTLYYFSEYVVNTALLEAIVVGNPKEALERLIDESAKVVGWFNDLAGGIMIHVFDKYLLDHYGKLALEAIDLGAVPVAEQIEIPYFFTPDLSRERGSETLPNP